MNTKSHAGKLDPVLGFAGILAIVVCSVVVMLVSAASARPESTMQQANRKRLSKALETVKGLSKDESNRIVDALVNRFGDKLIEKGYMPHVLALVNAGVFEQVSPRKIADAAYKTVAAVKRGAPPDLTVDLAQTCFSREMPEDQLLGAAMELRNFSTTRIPPNVYHDMVVQWLKANLGPHAMHAAMRAVQDGFRKGLDPQMVGLIVLDRLLAEMGYPGPGKMNDLPLKKAKRICKDEMKKMAYAGRRTKELERRKSIYQAMESAIKKGVPAQLGQEVFLTALRKQWSPEAAARVFSSMVKAAERGNTIEPLVDNFTKKLGKKATRSQAEKQAKKAEKKFESKPSQKRHTPKAKKLKKVALDKASMERSIKSFLGTPYLWGGNTRRGTDCSGFTSTVYREQGIIIPRVARDQAKFTKPIPKEKADFGDLVFFNKVGGKRVTHVGIYLGGGKMAHASCSKGVTITSLDRKYYQARFHSMGDVLAALGK